jgi:ABC-type bacteriocin/lantibiotic exporter with double-glycine peptidase domain
MKKNLKLVLFSFTRQTGADDCGAACLKTIFKYSGVKCNMPEEYNLVPLSLGQLKDISHGAGLSVRAVKMDTEHLQELESPAILHVMTDDLVPHFMVHFYYDAGLRLHLVGDPDKQVAYVTETELLRRWQSSAALIFEQLPENNRWLSRLYPWYNISRFDFVPGILWFAIPMLNAFGTLLGLGATLVIEKAVSPAFLDGQMSVLILIFTLLFSLSAAKCLINYFKERLIINFAGKLDSNLYTEFTSSIERSLFNPRLLTRKFSETIKDVQRIHQAASILIGGILCDGLIVLIMLAGLYFYFPALVLPELAIIMILLGLTDKQLPFMLINYQSSQFSLLQTSTQTHQEPQNRNQLIASAMEANSAFSKKSSRLSANANKLNLYFDAISSANIILVLAYTIGQLRSSTASYQEFIFGIILCYGVIATATKICNQLFLVAHGADMLGRRKAGG